MKKYFKEWVLVFRSGYNFIDRPISGGEVAFAIFMIPIIPAVIIFIILRKPFVWVADWLNKK